ncbi:MAG: abortive infection protein [Cyanobacteriota bacterium]
MGAWTGRLILPPPEERQIVKGVLFEVHHADLGYEALVGKVANLRWSHDPEVQVYVQEVTTDVCFTQQTQASKNQGNLHPDRLNHWPQVDPLESLAGARPDDQVMVRLRGPIVVENRSSDRPTLILSQEPIQITGRFYGLVTILTPQLKGRDQFLVRHFNPTSKQFDGAEEIVRIPQVPADREGVLRSTNKGIEKSPLNPSGWYIYGAKDGDGIFVVQAIAPRALFCLQPDEVLLGKKAGIAYINKQYWKDTAAQKGRAKTILLDPHKGGFNGYNRKDVGLDTKLRSNIVVETDGQTGDAPDEEKMNVLRMNASWYDIEPNSPLPINEAISRWQEGDRAIVLHTFGGRGGKKAEPAPFGLVTGHFAYGLASVVREPLTQELRFEIEYLQVYAHNPDGIVAGTMHWASYMGDLQRGWLGNRPVSDVLVKLDAVTEDYDFDGIKLSPWNEFTRHLEIMMARYRIGDGTGAAIVKPATSCVQDSNQALYVTIKRIEATVQSNPHIQNWLQRYPNHPQTRRFEKLVKLGRSLERQLVPLGIVRSDWQKNAQTLAGTRPAQNSLSHLFAALTTWRTVLPRRAHDELATLFLKQGASVWLIRTNQMGGFDPDITPRAPTALLSHRTR